MKTKLVYVGTIFSVFGIIFSACIKDSFYVVLHSVNLLGIVYLGTKEGL